MLKTTNYLIKETNLTLAIAYAGITKIKTNGLNGTATLSIQSSRENVLLVRQGKLKALKEVSIDFVVDYDKHIPEEIYNTAKGFIEIEAWDGILNQVITKQYPNYFNGWLDDRV
jgi:hypothetical protein